MVGGEIRAGRFVVTSENTLSPKNARKRPLSPHLQIYRPQITSVLSILHRLTGLGLWALGFVWVAFLSFPDHMTPVFQTGMGKVALAGCVWCLFYHLSNGLRHLMWDGGWGFRMSQVTRSGFVVVGVSCVLTLLTLGMWLGASGWMGAPHA